MKEIVKIIDEAGATKEVEGVAYFKLLSNSKEYLIYTENKVDASGNIEVCVSEVVTNENGSLELHGISDDAVWTEIKKVMLEIAKDGE